MRGPVLIKWVEQLLADRDERRAAILAAYRASGRNLRETVRLLGCTRETLYEQARRLDLVRELGMKPRPRKPEPFG
jgi:transcriptional regulator of acetoin/glycerol metabolism